uniref:Predicted nuclease of the RNAse H fold, HicB family n=1 Tax=Candidatus Kentrum sp. FW TaxID=2126338 RepID=A0A450TTQ3_9GAMM|nr:MAG: Predicted nuclease of the RNAse H fold, HicB family [Candidatus Kentron sp. FW]
MKDYHINIFYSEEDGGYIADIPDLKSCSAFGKTPDEALSEVLVAKESWLAVAMSNSKSIPTPEYRPVIYQVAASGSWRRGKPMNSETTAYVNGTITIDPDICNGKPTIRGKRITVQTILEFRASGNPGRKYSGNTPYWRKRISIHAWFLPVSRWYEDMRRKKPRNRCYNGVT